MELLENLNLIQKKLKNEPALLGDKKVKAAYNKLEKSVSSMLESIEPYRNIRFTEYLELKEALHGRTAKSKLPATRKILDKFNLSIKFDKNGKADVQKLIIEACRQNLALSIVKELSKKPEDIYFEDLFKMSSMREIEVRNYLDKKYDDSELKKFMKVTSVKIGKKKNKYDRHESINHIIDKLVEVRSRI